MALFYFFSSSTATGNHLKNNLLNQQASSDSELAKHRAKLSNSLTNIANDVIFRKSAEKDSVISSSKGLFLPSVQNVKHNVSEKVAQVSDAFFLSQKNYNFFFAQKKKNNIYLFVNFFFSNSILTFFPFCDWDFEMIIVVRVCFLSFVTL